MMSAESRKALHGRWLLRYGLQDAVAQWRDATADRAPTLAFVAVASDSRILHKLPPEVAERLAEQADHLARDMVATAGTVDVTRAAAEEAIVRVESWRKAVAASGRRAPRRFPLVGHMTSLMASERESAMSEQELFQRALLRHPDYLEPVAQRLTGLTLKLGHAGLARLGPPFDAVLALAAARFATQSSRKRGSAALSPDEQIRVLGIVEDWADLTGRNPCIVALKGSAASVAAQATALAADASDCAEATRRRDDRPSRQGVWEAAEEFNAYLVLSLQPRSLTEMEFDTAERFASAAARLAESALADPMVVLPSTPPGMEAQGPKLILATARAVLRNGALPRRSEPVAQTELQGAELGRAQLTPLEGSR